MSFIATGAVWLLLLIAGGASILLGNRPRLPQLLVIGLTLVAGGLWWLARPEAGAVETRFFLGRQWALSDGGWRLTGLTLFLLLSAAVYSLVNREVIGERRELKIGLLPLLTAAALPFLWAANAVALIETYTVFALAWGAVAWLSGSPEEDSRSRLKSALWMLSPLFPLWFALALFAADAVGSAHYAMAGLLLAALLLSGVRPFSGRRVAGASQSPAFAALLLGLPVILAGSLLSLIAGAPGLPAGQLALFTVLALIGILGGVWAIWRQPDAPATGSADALAALVLLVALWTDESALRAAVHLAVFAPILILWAGKAPGVTSGAATSMRPAGILHPRFLATGATLLILAGIPLAAGVGALAPLYDAWLEAGRYVLAAALALIWALLLGGLGLLVQGRPTDGETDAPGRTWLIASAYVLPLVGLLWPDVASLSEAGLLTWAVIVFAAVAGLLTARFAGPLVTERRLLDEVFAFDHRTGTAAGKLRRAGQATLAAAAEAAGVLEGEDGLLWLLGLLLVLFWIA